jgi:hypothetical protein
MKYCIYEYIPPNLQFAIEQDVKAQRRGKV